MATAAAVDIGPLIVTRPEFRGGRPCLACTVVPVPAIAAMHINGASAEEILERRPDLDAQRIYAALAYFHANRERILADWAEDEALAEEMIRQYPTGWPPVRS